MTQQMNIDNENINLELTVAEVNVILRSLGKHPFDEIVSLISKIKAQGESQVKEMVDAAQTAGAANS